jgi:hypothetical protein
LQHFDPDRPEAVAQLPDRLRGGVRAFDAAEGRDAAGERDGELEAGLGLVGPALELILGGEPAEGGVELDRVQPPGVEAQKIRRLGARRVEAALPGGVREAGRAGVEAAERYEPSMTS